MTPTRLTTALALAAALFGATGAMAGRAMARDGYADASVAPAAATPAREGRFPHARHAGLFPTCVGCHAGVVSGDAQARFPAPTTCVSCHDGSRASRVSWGGPAPAPSNVRFSHVEHVREVVADSQRTGGGAGDPALQCGACHRMANDPRFMAVERARPETCLGCHAHAAPAHLDVRNDCRTCHVPLVRATALPAERIGRFPRPPSHDTPDFARRHAPRDERDLAQCATCHAQQSCARCHADARSRPSIAALGGDPRVALLLAGRAGSWPLPASHERRDWTYEHGDDARRETASCATCHAQPGCRSCHIGPGAARVIRRLPAPDSGSSPGVPLRPARSAGATSAARGPSGDDADHAPAVAPLPIAAAPHPSWALPTRDTTTARDTTRVREVRVHAASYARTHGAEASTQQLDCTGCHAQRFCSDCHAGEGRRRFHPSNFVQRHPSDAWGREQDCASCHNAEVFCRGCHVSSGLASQGGLSSAYHTRQPGWLLQHGQAARQGLESCTTCHAQRDCMQCHSRSGWNVSPHGRDFDAARMQRRARGLCTACHVGDPLAGRP